MPGGYAVLAGQHGRRDTARPIRPDLAYFDRRQTGGRVGLSLWSPLGVRIVAVALPEGRAETTFGPHVSHVVGVSAKEEVIRPDTASDVAPVKNVKAVQRHLGHASLQSTAIYTQLTDEHARQLIAGAKF